MEQSTQKLVEYISPGKKGWRSLSRRNVDSHIKSADERMQKVINEKSKRNRINMCKHRLQKHLNPAWMKNSQDYKIQ